ncbi:putative intracellular protease/amidase [Sphingobium sp. OAS761]|uniref:DJ-1/PfpI family protein n=1 Tax=Sphingobium sp. OAS761 TaxID=2817901 RepID=UPI0020A20137|nr:DJ-1/PfpI family protein [Sphingobium sp. OAS761]MCP1470154.1 putative intracellular protease/amidase [Sphingobium sp. OAS761]
MTDHPHQATRRDLLIAATALSAIALPARAATQMSRNPPTPPDGPKKMLGMVVFEGFELLDVFGPLEMFGMLNDRIDTVLIADKAGPVKSRTGPATIADVSFADAPKLDIVMVPGGSGTRREVNNPAFLAAVKALADATPQVASVCTGSGVLAKAGLLNGVKATSNKMAWEWATAQGAQVLWVPHARWVEDGKYISSSGISAGTDMALGLIARLYGKEMATWVANRAEYRWHDDPSDDPFAAMSGL